MDLETLIEQLGFGKYQQRLIVLAILLDIFTGLPYITNIFQTEKNSYRCVLPWKTRNGSILEIYSGTSPLTDELLEVNETTLHGENTTAWSTCHHNRANIENDNIVNDSMKDYIACDHWVYDTSIFTSTIMTEFDLTCNKEWLRHLARSAYMFGMFFGAFVAGVIGDRYGRRYAMLMSLSVLAFGGIASALSVDYVMFFLCQVILGFGATGLFESTFLIVVENTSRKLRNALSMSTSLSNGAGKVIASIVGYFIRDWRWLQITLTIPGFILLPALWFVPHDPRWLLVKGRKDEAVKYFERVAEMNKVEISTDLLYGDKLTTVDDNGSHKGKGSVTDLFHFPQLRKTALLLFFIWLSISVMYYGFSVNASVISGNIFLNVGASMAMEIPANLLAILLNNRFGRKRTMMFSHFFAGVVGILPAFLPQSWLWKSAIANSLAKFAVTIAFGTLFLYTSEIFPTEYRGTCFGMYLMFSRIGGVCSPFIVSAVSIYEYLPMLFMGSLSVISGSMFYFMPETKGCNLPQTLEDCEQFQRKQSVNPLKAHCCCPRDENSGKDLP